VEEMKWSDVIDDPVLTELPFKIELNEWGKIEMSPASNLHGMLQTAIVFNLKLLCEGGKAFVECSIETTKNVKVADVVWASSSFYARNGNETPFKESPEIVVEVASPSNTLEELMNKKELYFEKGAKEVWLCSEDGVMSFYSVKGKITESLQCPTFPKVVEA
jgi:Uma2 family endonuclease